MARSCGVWARYLTEQEGKGKGGKERGQWHEVGILGRVLAKEDFQELVSGEMCRNKMRAAPCPPSLPPFPPSSFPFPPPPGDENARGPACLRGLVLGPPLDVQGEQGALRDGGERLDEGFEGPAPVFFSLPPTRPPPFLLFVFLSSVPTLYFPPFPSPLLTGNSFVFNRVALS